MIQGAQLKTLAHAIKSVEITVKGTSNWLVHNLSARYTKRVLWLRFRTMQHRQRWLLVFAMLLTVWGQFTYACEAMDMPPQPACCCEDGMARCDKLASSASEDGCEHVGSVASSESCCAVEYQSAFEDVAPTSSSTDQALTWPDMIAQVFWPYLDSLSTRSPTTPPPNPDWLLAQAESGRTVYLSTLRLRI